MNPNMQSLTLGLAQQQAAEQAQDTLIGPSTQTAMQNAPVIDDETIETIPSLKAESVLLWADGPLPEGVILPADTDTKRLVLREDQSPIGFPSEDEAETFLGSEEGQKLIQYLGTQGATSVGIRALNGGGVPLWDLLMYSIVQETPGGQS